MKSYFVKVALSDFEVFLCAFGSSEVDFLPNLLLFIASENVSLIMLDFAVSAISVPAAGSLASGKAGSIGAGFVFEVVFSLELLLPYESVCLR